MGPFVRTFGRGHNGINTWLYLSDIGDYYWGKGPVGFQIDGPDIDGFWFLTITQ